VPWLFLGASSAVVWSIAVSAIAALGIGGYLGWQTGRGMVWSAMRQLLVIAAAALITYFVGRIFRVAVT
jgi:VIT1/CCC1 family predicted Fe2+/Mn2+ transporter